MISGPERRHPPGNALPLAHIPLGTVIHNVELKPGKGAQLVRSAGVGAQLMAHEGDYATLRLPSGEIRLVHVRCQATIGQVGNLEHENRSIGKAGRSRWLGKRPNVRGVTMNPIDHPMGGGEGKSSGGRHPCTPWGKPTKGYKTRKNRCDGQVDREATGGEVDGALAQEGSLHRPEPAEEGRAVRWRRARSR